MNVKKVVNKLKKDYLGRKIILNDDQNPTEIVCEYQPTSENPNQSAIIAVIDKIIPHYHKISTELYEVLKGPVTLYVDGQKHILQDGKIFEISPGRVHYAEGKEAWVRCTSTPGWTFEDHLLVEKEK